MIRVGGIVRWPYGAAETAPILVLVDDLPWVDLPTRRVLLYIAEQLEVERVALIASRRTDSDVGTDTGAGAGGEDHDGGRHGGDRRRPVRS